MANKTILGIAGLVLGYLTAVKQWIETLDGLDKNLSVFFVILLVVGYNNFATSMGWKVRVPDYVLAAIYGFSFGFIIGKLLMLLGGAR